jgi:hypothetical protein
MMLFLFFLIVIFVAASLAPMLAADTEAEVQIQLP